MIPLASSGSKSNYDLFDLVHMKDRSHGIESESMEHADIDVRRLTCMIREESLRLGFAQTGFTRAGMTPHTEQFREWLRDGFHGEMHYLERQVAKRANPDQVLSGVRSIIVTTLNYAAGGNDSVLPLQGRISSYALSVDYHTVVRERLERLLAFIRSKVPNVRGICHVETGPVSEKIWATETSIGWMGKHTGVGSRRLGTHFFLGVILLNIPLNYDDRSEGFCGTCQRCLEACPTHALLAPYRLDARRCLSYLTIEFRGVISRELRPLVGHRIFGCDECRNACPWNRFAVAPSAEELAPGMEDSTLDLLPLVEMSREEFERRFAGSPVRRATRDGFVRNVIVALGNSRRIEAIPALLTALHDESPLVRIHAVWAVWALGRTMQGESRAVLESARERETNADVLAEIAHMLKEQAEAE